MKKLNCLWILSVAFVLGQLAVIHPASAQSYKQKLADKEYTNMRYANASQYYEEVLSKDTGNTEVKKKLADCYFKINDTKRAEKLYRKLVMKNILDSVTLLNFAEVLSQNGRYLESKKFYRKYLDRYPGARAEKSIKTLNNVGKLYADSANYKIYFSCFNSPQSDFSPTPYGKGIVFSSARSEGVGVKRVYGWDNSAYLDLYFADTAQCDKRRFFTSVEKEDMDTSSYSDLQEKYEMHPDESYVTANDTRTLGFHGIYFKPDTIWNKDKDKDHAVRFNSTLNTKYHEGPASFSGDSVVYFTRNNYNGWGATKSDEKTTNLNIYVSRKKGDSWSKPKLLPFCNKNYSVGHPAIAKDGKTLYFASNMPGGKGKTDIYRSVKQSGKWTKPENLGDAVNTAGDDLFPFIDANNNLFFASDGNGGLGGLDIFRIKLTDNLKVEDLKNMGFPVNSKKDDFGFIINKSGRTGFFSSNRKRGGPDDDIFMFTYTPKIRLEGKVLFVQDESPIDSADVHLALGKLPVGGMVTGKDGSFVFEGLEPNQAYNLPVLRNTFAAQNIEFYTLGVKPGETITFNVYMDKALHISLEGTFTDKITKDPLLFEPVVLVNKTRGDTTKANTDQYGRFYFKLQPGNNYEVFGTKGSTKSNIEARSTKGITSSTTLGAFLYIPPPHECDFIKQKYFIENTYYDLAQADIRPEARATLDRVVKMLKDEPALTLEFSSHTDNKGSSIYNARLSKRRTQKVYRYLVDNDIDSLRLKKSSAGETQPVNNCMDGVNCPEKDQQQNRRTQYVVWRNGVNITALRCTDDFVVQGKAYSTMTKDPMDSIKITLIDKKDGSIVASSITSSDGRYSFDIKSNQNYTIKAENEDCGTNANDFTTVKIKAKEVTIDFPMLCAGDVIKVDNIYFDLGKYNIRKDAAKELDKVVAIMKKYKKMKIELRSHTDSRGSSESNFTLSDHRAKSSAAYIVSKGIAKDRIQGKGYGESLPLNECIDGTKCSEADYQKNRRTEFKILSVR